MKVYESKDIRNVAVLGHGGSGKTIITEAMAFKTKLVDRMGKHEDCTTISDYDQEEHNRKISINTSLVPVEYKNTKINILDTPGYFDFIGEQRSALRVCETALMMISGTSGVEVGTEKSWEVIKEQQIPTIVIINKVDRENIDFQKCLDNVKNFFGSKAISFNLPINPGLGFNKIYDILTNKAYEYANGEAKEISDDTYADEGAEILDALMETVASADEALMEKYLEGEEFTPDELINGIRTAIANFELIPIICTTATGLVGVDAALDTICKYSPSPLDSQREELSPDKPATALVFKTIADPYVGRLSLFKVISGKINAGLELTNLDRGKKEKLNHIYTMIGKKQLEIPSICAGDIGAFSKLADTFTNNILSASSEANDVKKVVYPKANIFLSISPKSKNDEDKLGNGVARIKEEDLTVVFERNNETNENLIYGIGEMQLQVIASKLKSKFSVEVVLKKPIIPYRETIKKKATAEGKHKKQSGGSGQYGVVSIDFEPTFDLSVDLEFVDKVVGGTVPRQFIPAVEKGLRKCVLKGVLAGYPVFGLKATLFDGKYHPVDSDEMSFITAASLAYKAGLPLASPVLLEPIYKVSITVPEKYMGDIMGDLNKKRGKIMGMEQVQGGKQTINAEAPLSELFEYATQLRSITQGRGEFEMAYERYEEVPAMFSDKIIADAKALKE